MATSSLRSLSKSKLFSLPLSITWRGYAAQVGAGLGRGGCMSTTNMVGSKVEDQRAAIKGSIASNHHYHSAEEPSNAWAPDPLTGNYRPANRVDEIDPAELRQMLLNHKVKPL